MRLQDFIKALFEQPAVDGYKLGRVEIDVCVRDKILYVGGETSCVKITIVPTGKYAANPAIQALGDVKRANETSEQERVVAQAAFCKERFG